ncbi:hypothetical protein Tco_0872800 [Tanacetum coccineum]
MNLYSLAYIISNYVKSSGINNGSGERGVKEKNLNKALNNEEVNDGVIPSSTVSFGINNGADVTVLLESIRLVSERYANSAYGFFLGKWVAYPVVSNYVRNTWGKYGLVKSMLNSSIRLFFFQFSSMDGLDSMLEIGVRVARPLSEKTDANTSGNKKKDVEPTKEVSNSNPFDVLNSVENDVDLGTNGGLQICTSTTPIVEKIDKIERLTIDGKVTLVDDEGKPSEKVDSCHTPKTWRNRIGNMGA